MKTFITTIALSVALMGCSDSDGGSSTTPPPSEPIGFTEIHIQDATGIASFSAPQARTQRMALSASTYSDVETPNPVAFDIETDTYTTIDTVTGDELPCDVTWDIDSLVDTKDGRFTKINVDKRDDSCKKYAKDVEYYYVDEKGKSRKIKIKKGDVSPDLELSKTINSGKSGNSSEDVIFFDKQNNRHVKVVNNEFVTVVSDTSPNLLFDGASSLGKTDDYALYCLKTNDASCVDVVTTSSINIDGEFYVTRDLHNTTSNKLMKVNKDTGTLEESEFGFAGMLPSINDDPVFVYNDGLVVDALCRITDLASGAVENELVVIGGEYYTSLSVHANESEVACMQWNFDDSEATPNEVQALITYYNFETLETNQIETFVKVNQDVTIKDGEIVTETTVIDATSGVVTSRNVTVDSQPATYVNIF